jgi:hypothetical protein
LPQGSAISWGPEKSSLRGFAVCGTAAPTESFADGDGGLAAALATVSAATTALASAAVFQKRQPT